MAPHILKVRQHPRCECFSCKVKRGETKTTHKVIKKAASAPRLSTTHQSSAEIPQGVSQDDLKKYLLQKQLKINQNKSRVKFSADTVEMPLSMACNLLQQGSSRDHSAGGQTLVYDAGQEHWLPASPVSQLPTPFMLNAYSASYSTTSYTSARSLQYNSAGHQEQQEYPQPIQVHNSWPTYGQARSGRYYGSGPGSSRYDGRRNWAKKSHPYGGGRRYKWRNNRGGELTAPTDCTPNHVPAMLMNVPVLEDDDQDFDVDAELEGYDSA